MIQQEFDKIVDARIEKIRSVLKSKGTEYSSDADRLENFKNCAKMEGGTPVESLRGFWVKHLDSLLRMLRDPQQYTEAQWDEKIGDSITYHILLEALLTEQRASSALTSTSLYQGVIQYGSVLVTLEKKLGVHEQEILGIVNAYPGQFTNELFLGRIHLTLPETMVEKVRSLLAGQQPKHSKTIGQMLGIGPDYLESILLPNNGFICVGDGWTVRREVEVTRKSVAEILYEAIGYTVSVSLLSDRTKYSPNTIIKTVGTYYGMFTHIVPTNNVYARQMGDIVADVEAVLRLPILQKSATVAQIADATKICPHFLDNILHANSQFVCHGVDVWSVK